MPPDPTPSLPGRERPLRFVIIGAGMAWTFDRFRLEMREPRLADYDTRSVPGDREQGART